MRDRRMRVAEVAAESGLAVRAGGDEPEALELARGGDGGEEAADRVRPLVFERRGRHRQECVVGEEVEQACDVTGLESGDEAVDELALLS